jgi:hypothetical protein
MTHDSGQGREIIGRGKWATLIDEATYESVAHKLNDAARKTNTTGNARIYLLAGLGVCSTCGAPLRGRPLHHTTYTAQGRWPSQRPDTLDYGDRAYTCSTGKHAHRSVALVDAVVAALMVERLSRLDLAGALVDDDAADEARALNVDRDALRARLDALADDYADGALSSAAYTKATTRIEANLAQLDEAIGAASERAKAPVAILDGMTGEAAQAAWDNADLGRRRALVGLLTTRVALRGGGRGGVSRFDPACVEVDWR